MEDNHKILSFSNIDIIEYLNKVHLTDDRFLIETQKHEMKKCIGQLEDQMHIAFVSNSEALLEILDTYQYCYDTIKFSNIPKLSKTQESINVNSKRCALLASILSKFEEDMEPFITNNRYLVNSLILEDYILVLTNDLVLIGTKDEHSEKYVLKSSLLKSIFDIEKDDCKLIIKVDGISYEIKGNKDKIDDFYESFREINYKKEEEMIIDLDLIEYFYALEKREELSKYFSENHILNFNDLKKCIKKKNSKSDSNHNKSQDKNGLIDNNGYRKSKNKQQDKNSLIDNNEMDEFAFNYKITTIEDLQFAMKFSPGKEAFIFKNFMSKRFREGLETINKIQKMENVINDCFDFLESFCDPLRDICESVCSDKKGYYVATVETLIKDIMDIIEKRVFNKFYLKTECNNNINLVFKRLKFKKMNFEYLIEEFKSREKGFAKKCIETAKEEITKKIEQYFDKDNTLS